jgi:hypothetical protein
MSTIVNPHFVTFYNYETITWGPDNSWFYEDVRTPCEEPGSSTKLPPIACSSEEEAVELSTFLNGLNGGERAILAMAEAVPYSRTLSVRLVPRKGWL